MTTQFHHSNYCGYEIRLAHGVTIAYKNDREVYRSVSYQAVIEYLDNLIQDEVERLADMLDDHEEKVFHNGEWVPRSSVYKYMTDEEKKIQDEIDDGMDEFEERRRSRIAEANEY